MEEIEFILDSTKESMVGSIAHLEKEFLNIRAGKASPQMLGSVFVDYYGSQTPLSQVSNVNVPDARTITIQPYEKSMLQTIEKAIMVANLGFNPMNNGENIIISVPPLTEERRKDLIKVVKSEGESSKISVRNIRRDSNDELKKLTKNKPCFKSINMSLDSKQMEIIPRLEGKAIKFDYWVKISTLEFRKQILIPLTSKISEGGVFGTSPMEFIHS